MAEISCALNQYKFWKSNSQTLQSLTSRVIHRQFFWEKRSNIFYPSKEGLDNKYNHQTQNNNYNYFCVYNANCVLREK